MVQRYFNPRRDAGTWARVNYVLVMNGRPAARREASPTAGIIDSQSVKTAESGGPNGDDAGQRIHSSDYSPSRSLAANSAFLRPEAAGRNRMGLSSARHAGRIARGVAHRKQGRACGPSDDGRAGLIGTRLDTRKTS